MVNRWVPSRFDKPSRRIELVAFMRIPLKVADEL